MTQDVIPAEAGISANEGPPLVTETPGVAGVRR
jgi:hypothetical protein